jgi:hypothetical protein
MERNNTKTGKKYVWLSPDYKFSNSWDEETQKRFITEEEYNKAFKEKGWRLIEYTCLNDDKFEFYNMMRMA